MIVPIALTPEEIKALDDSVIATVFPHLIDAEVGPPMNYIFGGVVTHDFKTVKTFRRSAHAGSPSTGSPK